MISDGATAGSHNRSLADVTNVRPIPPDWLSRLILTDRKHIRKRQADILQQPVVQRFQRLASPADDYTNRTGNALPAKHLISTLT